MTSWVNLPTRIDYKMAFFLVFISHAYVLKLFVLIWQLYFVTLAQLLAFISEVKSYLLLSFKLPNMMWQVTLCLSSMSGEVYFLQHHIKLNFTEAEEACQSDGGRMAKVGQLYAAWRFVGLDQCDAGWLADGSVRYPIIQPRMNCGTSEQGVRSFGFPPKHLKHGVYCYKVRW